MRTITAISVAGLEAPSARFRLYELLPHLSAAGYACTVHAPPRVRSLQAGFAGWLTILREARRADVVVVQKRLLRRSLTRALASTGTPIVFDFDDALFVSPAGGSASASHLTRLKALLGESSLCVAGNDYLANWAREYCAEVRVIPTGLDTERWRPAARRDHEGVVLGWVGTAGNLAYLESIAPAIAAIQRESPSVRLVVVCDAKPKMQDVHWEFRLWSLQKEIDNLSDIEVGLMPLSDDAWTQGKCGFKAIQFMALGNPVVASPVGVNASIVRDYVNGLTATTIAEWIDALRLMVREAPRRRQMGAEARATVVRSYDTRVVADQLVSSLDEVLA